MSQSTSATSRLSLWAATAPVPRRPPLAHDVRCDVCVVGGGIAGLSTAYHLARAGRSVVLVDDGALGGGMTAMTTAHLVTALDDRYFDLEKLHGPDGAKLAAQSHTVAIDTIERVVAEEAIECEFRRLDGYLFAPPNDSDDIEREFEAVLRARLRVERVSSAPIMNFHTGPALRFREQGQFHPLRYLAGLATAAEKRGARIFCDTKAESIEGGTEARVTMQSGRVVKASAIVVATNAPVNDLVTIHTKQAPYTSYVIAAEIAAGAVAPALFWDTRESNETHGHPVPYHYVRLARGPTGDLLLVGGADHKSGQEADGRARLASLAQWARARWPIGNVAFEWAGQVMEPVDGLAFIGHNPLDKDNVYVVTGDSGNGMTHGTIAGLLLTDLICRGASPWQSLYEPARITLRAAGTFARENVNVVTELAKGYLGPGEVAGEDEIAAGSGAILRAGAGKIAVYRDEDGTLHRLSAACPHLGCIVAWNAVQSTWDCPCHGSRFGALGEVINGPANRALAPAKSEALTEG